jgi:O-antigen ligase
MVFNPVLGAASRRICGFGILNDPNDFAQYLIVCLGLLALFWTRNALSRLLLVIVPAGILIFAIYLTFSRGAIFGLLAVAYVLVSRRMRGLPSFLLMGGLLFALVVFQFGGGRGISTSDASAGGRLMAWGVGLGLIKQAPLFGVGFGQFRYIFGSQTAHNSWILCFAELGFFGYFFWMSLLVTTMWALERLKAAYSASPETEEFARHVTAIRAGLYGFLATAWFLSRTYNETLYILLGLGAVLIHLVAVADPEKVKLQIGKWLPRSVALQFASIVIVYVLIRLRSL